MEEERNSATESPRESRHGDVGQRNELCGHRHFGAEAHAGVKPEETWLGKQEVVFECGEDGFAAQGPHTLRRGGPHWGRD